MAIDIKELILTYFSEFRIESTFYDDYGKVFDLDKSSHRSMYFDNPEALTKMYDDNYLASGKNLKNMIDEFSPEFPMVMISRIIDMENGFNVMSASLTVINTVSSDVKDVVKFIDDNAPAILLTDYVFSNSLVDEYCRILPIKPLSSVIGGFYYYDGGGGD